MLQIRHALFALPATLLMAATPCKGPATEDPAPNTLSAIEKKEGWKLLFDGKNLKGWHIWGRPGTPGNQWDIKDDAIHLDKSKKEHGDLLTDSSYGDFDLKLEWKISPKGNSGILFYVYEDTARYKEPYYTGPEMQVLDNDGHKDGKIHKHRAGDLYDLIASSSEPVKPVGQWNAVEIESKNGRLKFFLNGVNVVSTNTVEDSWTTLIAGSKFKNWPDFGKFSAGRISLQDHDCEVWYRNIKIKRF